MSLLHAFLDQVIVVLITLLIGYPQLKEMPESFWHTGIYYAAFMVLIGGTWIRWYFQLTLMGILKYMF